MNIYDAITKRRSVRLFKKEPVAREDIFILCEMALHAPTAGDLQEIKCIISQDRKLIRALPGICMDQTWINGAQAVIAVCSQPKKQEEYFGPQGNEFARMNASAATQNILLTATALGLGACWISGFEQQKVDDLFGASGTARVEAIVAIGKPAENPKRREKHDITSAVFFDQYGNNKPDLEALNKDYAIKLEHALEEAQARLQDHEEEMGPFFTKMKQGFDRLLKGKK